MNEEIFQEYQTAGQDQVFRFYEDLSPPQQDSLLEQAKTIQLEEVAHLVKTLLPDSSESTAQALPSIQPAPYIPVPEHGGDADQWSQAVRIGEEALRAGRVAAFVVAGGQGTRLGFEGPKGTFPASPVTGKSLFQIFAEKLQAASRRYQTSIPWFVLTSKLNHADTVAFFEKHNHFGLPREDVIFLIQGLMPAVDGDGKILLQDKDQIALSPDGHGGSLRALVRSGSVDIMKERGIDLISYFQVDNPLIRCIDPAFLGFHLQHQSEMSSKACLKAYAAEKVGVFVEVDGQTQVLEYSDLPPGLAEAQEENGDLRIRAGSIAIHILSRDLVERLGSAAAGPSSLPFHRAFKKVPTLDDSGTRIQPTEPNGYKFEAFVFDAIPLARNPLIVETLRREDFSPIKNAEGVDSPQTSKADQLRQFARWCLAAGIDLSVDDTGLPSIEFEVSPLYADSEQAFLERVRESLPQVKAGTVLS